MEIAKATNEDIDSILVLQKQIYRVDTVSENARKILGKQFKDDTCNVLVARQGDKVIATATIYYIEVAVRALPYAFLEGLVVSKSKRGHGVGSALFKECIRLARQKNCYKMIFTSGQDRPDAHKFYEKLGFKKWGLEFRMDL